MQCQARSLTLRECLHKGMDDLIKYIKPPICFPFISLLCMAKLCSNLPTVIFALTKY